MAIRRSPEPDASLRRVQRDAAIVCAVFAALALAIMGGRPEGALGVLAGGALMAVSYFAIKGGVDAAMTKVAMRPDIEPDGREGSGQASRPLPINEAPERPTRSPAASRAAAWAAFKFIARYGVIAVLAWAILVPLHAHPLGVFAGVTAPVVAIGIEAVRLVRRRS